MMLHRHFENENASEEMTKLADISGDKEREFVSDIFPPVTEEEKPKRKRKTTDK